MRQWYIGQRHTCLGPAGVEYCPLGCAKGTQDSVTRALCRQGWSTVFWDTTVVHWTASDVPSAGRGGVLFSGMRQGHTGQRHTCLMPAGVEYCSLGCDRGTLDTHTSNITPKRHIPDASTLREPS
jgi:hypothetical protein